MNGLAHITIAGQQVGLKFGLPAVQRLMEKMGVHDMFQDGLYTELGIIHIIYAGYANYCLMHDVSETIPFEQFYEQIEGLDNEQTKQETIKAIRAFEESKYVKKAIAVNKEEEVKKKATMTLSQSTGTESNPSALENSDTHQENITD
jgi:hypothetical protein